MTESLKPT
jgi:hypothetical protein